MVHLHAASASPPTMLRVAAPGRASAAALLLGLAQHGGQAVEPALLLPASLVEPVPGDAESLLLEAADADATLLARRHEPGLLEHAHVLQHGRDRHAQRLRQGRRRGGAERQALEDRAPGPVAKGVEDGVGGGMLRHRLKYLDGPPKSQVVT